MANTRNRTYRVLAWALAIALTVLSLPIVPFSTWSSNLTNAIGDSMSINAHAYSFDNRPRVGAWWWHKEDGTNATIRENYLNLLESAGITEVYFYAGWDFSGKSISSSTMSEIHTFVQAAMQHGMATSFLMDDLGYMKNMATNFITYRNTYPDDWAYGFHFDYEKADPMRTSFVDAENYFVANNIYVEYDFNPAWSTTSGSYTSPFLGTISGNLYQVFAQIFANGKGCMHLMAYRTKSAQAIFDRAQEVNTAVTVCKNYNCDVVIGMECTEHESDGSVLQSTVSLAVYGVDKNGVVDYIHGVRNLMAATGLTCDYGVAIHHARSFSQDIDGTISSDRTTSYNGGGATESRTQGSYSQITTTTRDISGQTLTKQALYYKGNESQAVSAGGEYVNSAMISALVADYTAKGAIDPDSGEYYEIIMTGTENTNGNYIYAVLFDSLGSETWADESTTTVSTSLSTISYKYPNGLNFSSTGRLRLYDETGAGTFTVKSIEVNVYRWSSGGGDVTQPSQSQTQPSQGTDGNLLINGDLQVTDTAASGFGWTTTNVKNTNFSVGSFAMTASKDNGGLSQTVNGLQVGHTYTLTVTTSAGSPTIKVDGTAVSSPYTFTATSTSTTVSITGARNSSFTVTGATLLEKYTAPSTPTSQSSQSSSSSTTKTTTTTKAATTTQAVTPTGNNLLKNGDFGITDTNNSEFGWSAEKFNSISGGVASVTNGNEDKKGLKQFVAFEPGETYVLSGTIAEASNPVMLFLSNASGATHVTTLPNGQFSYTFTADSSMNCVLFGGYQYSFKISDVQLHKAGSGEEESSVPAATYTVSVTNGTTDKATAAAGETVTITANGAATGMQFKNWTASGVTFANANSAVTTFVMPAANVAVTANYENISYNVAVSLGTAKVNGVAVTKAQYGQTVTLTADTPATGMEFDKWVTKSGSAPVTFASATSTSTTFTMPAGAVSVEATYKAKTYTVTVNNGTASPTSQMYNNTVTITANAAQAGYQFSGWTSNDGVSFANASNSQTTFTMPAKNVTVTANYTKINYTVSVTGGTASKTTANVGDTITLTPGTAPSGKVFDKWTSTPSVTFTGNTFTMPASNVSITATYKNAAYTVTVNNGSASPAGGAMGDTITITANAPATGKVFDKWTTSDGVTFANANSATTTFTLPANNVTVTATYKDATYTVSMTYGTANPTSAKMGASVAITAQTRSGYVFDKWTSSDVTFANANSSSTTFTMPAKNVSITATYKQLYTVSVNGGSASPSSAVAGTEITLTPESRSGFTFSSWSSSDVTVVNNKFTMPAKNVSVTANFTEVIVDPDPPATPTLVSATADGYNVIFKWNAVSGAAGYRVYRKSGSGSYATVKDITGGTTVTYTDEALAKGTYTYTVQAYVNGTSGKIWGDYNAAGKSATVTFGTPVLTSAVASASGITVTWQKVTGATGYRLYRKDGTNWVTVKTIADANTVSYLAKGLISGQTYTYTVQAYYDSTVTGTTQWSGYDTTGVSATAEFGTPETEGQANGMKITINWDAVSGAEGYRIYRKTADTSWRTVAMVEAPTTTYTDENPVANVYYTYTVQAYTTEGGVKVYSTYDATGTTARVVLSTPTLSEAEVTGEGVVVSWEAVTGATGYRLYRWNGSAWKTVKTVIGINTTSYTDRNANAVAGAKYTVQAFRNADGVNVWSNHTEAGVTAA